MQKVLGKEQVWLEITEVHYKDGVPEAFAIEMKTPMVPHDEHDTDEERIASLRWTLDKMLEALRHPILDERKDFDE